MHNTDLRNILKYKVRNTFSSKVFQTLGFKEKGSFLNTKFFEVPESAKDDKHLKF